MTTLALVRHGQTDWNLNRRIQGSTDIPLNATGRADALAAAERLRTHEWHAVYTSPLRRALDTAVIIADELGLGAPKALATIVERNYGEAEGLTGEQVLERYPDQMEVPGRETREAVTRRVAPALIELAKVHPGSRLIVVTHGGVIGSMLRWVSDGALPVPGEVIANGSVHEFVYQDGDLHIIRGGETHGPRDMVQSAVR